MKPLIGITSERIPTPDEERYGGIIRVPWNYSDAVIDAGGVPLIIPPGADPEAVLPILDGLLIPGGRDIDASNWGEANHPSCELQDPARFDTEKEIFRRLEPEMPVLGICYGCQALNVFRGGSIEQHIPDRIPDSRHEGGTLETVEIVPGSKLEKVVGPGPVEGKSYHHQAIARIGDGLRAVARHADGTVEAVEATDRPWMIGVQWHPERTPESDATKRLFREFVAAAAAFRARRLGLGAAS